MAFRFGDPGGRAYGSVGASQVNLLSWWNGASGVNMSNWSLTASGGRTTGTCINMVLGNATIYISKTFDSQATWGLAFAVKFSATPGTIVIASFIDSGTVQVDLRVLSDGTLRVTRAGTTLGTSTVPIAFGVYNHIEWKTTIHNTAGSTEIRLNGVSILNPTPGALNTRATANASANAFALGHYTNLSSTGAINCSMDDIIIYDGVATDAAGNPDINTFIGDCGLTWIVPSGAGTTTNFTPDSGSNYARVNEATPDGDTSYVESSTVGHIDTYAAADLPGGAASVKSMALVSYARKTDVGSRGMKHEIRTNSTDVAHTTEYPLTDSYQYYMSAWGQNPTGTPANWTVADINALEIGRKVSS